MSLWCHLQQRFWVLMSRKGGIAWEEVVADRCKQHGHICMDLALKDPGWYCASQFIDWYFKMCRNKTCIALLVSAFHRFGCNCGGTVADGKGDILRRGKWIPIQMTVAGWWKGKFRGKAPAVPWRSPKGLTNRTTTSCGTSSKKKFTRSRFSLRPLEHCQISLIINRNQLSTITQLGLIYAEVHLTQTVGQECTRTHNIVG